MKYIWSYIKKYPMTLVLTLLGSLIFVAVSLGLPTILANIMNESLVQGDLTALWQNVGGMFGLVILGFFGNLLTVLASSQLTTRVVRDIRNDLYKRIQFYSHQEYDEIGVPSMITRMINDAFIIMQFTEMLLRSGSTPILMIGGSIFLIFTTAPSLSWILFSSMPVIFLIFYLIVRRSRPLSESLQVILDKINLYARENLTGLRVIRAFAREDLQEEKFQSANHDYADVAMRLNKLMGAANPLFAHILMWVTVFTLWFSTGLIESQVIEVGSILAFCEYLFQALFSIMIFSQIFMLSPRALASAHRLEEMMDLPLSISINEEGVTSTPTQGYIEFDGVDFAYPDEPDHLVLKDISFTAEPGQTIAFIGSTGSGKSSVVQLIPRLYDVSQGQVLIDGVDVRDYQLHALRDKIGFVPQKIQLFTGTVAENLRLGKADASKEEMDLATDIAQAQEFIQDLDHGYDSFLAESGTNLSGGQKQRLSIARAIVKDPAIYIFDDSFSALDYQTDAKVRRRLKEVSQNSTVLIVAQRVSSITQADKIIVLDRGEIVGMGTHDELIANNRIYQEIAQSQEKSDTDEEVQ